jgi:hypothetical protein
VTLRELAASDLTHTLEDSLGAGTRYRLIHSDGMEFEVTGAVGDISLLLDPVTGERARSRSIECAYRLGALPILPRRSWRATVPGPDGQALNLFVQDVAPDRTIGVCRLTLGVDAEGSDA